ncbi:MAG: peptidoglycan endopeptidase [Proteobacteria bacterium]|jgi:cell wall-associated NlpC family hydrolase|nr:NlpC/P60 family protein [Alphaproteobacteria bacterium]NCC02535.1 peptidoglycan endopeptidase [Pseudomonadota bacterium]
MAENTQLDPRLNAYRADMAHVALQGVVQSERFVEPKLYQCIKGLAPMLAEPKGTAPRISETRYGEFLDVFETREDGYAWVQNRNDSTVGYILAEKALLETIAALVNRVSALHTFVYREPDIKSATLDRLTLGSFVSLDGEDGEFYVLASGGYVYKKHIVPSDEVQTPDYVFTAGQLLGVPYLTGGRTPLGIDSCGLVQLALDLAGHEAPRFYEQIHEVYGHPLPCHWRDILWKRGDLVFFDRTQHIAIVTGPDHVIHASPQTMTVTVEPLDAMVKRGYIISAAGRP